MGLDARVRCTCIKEGKTTPFPFPGRLAFDKCGDPFLLSQDEAAAQEMRESEDMSELHVFDKWEYDLGCGHDGHLVRTRIGNIAYVGHVREWINAHEQTATPRFPILLKRVVYSGSHCGDCINSSDAGALLRELEILASLAQDEHHRAFVESMLQLCKASLASGNPIVF
jgi:hypothetical protein